MSISQTTINSLQNTLDAEINLLNSKIALLTAEINYELTNGPRVSYSVGNRSVSWNEFKAELNTEIKDLGDSIEKLIELVAKLSSFDITEYKTI